MNYITTKQASEFLGVKLRTVQDWCRLNKLPNIIKMGRIFLINKDELTKWLKQQEQRPNKIWALPKYERRK